MKYKVGDKVRVKDNLTNDFYGIYIPSRDMRRFAGRVVTIAAIPGAGGDSYRIVEQTMGNHWWTDEMFEGLVEAAPEPEPQPHHGYKVGDKVRLREDLATGNYGSCYCCDSMARHAGEVVTIREIHKEISNRFYIKEDLHGCPDHWDWSFEMLDGIAEEAAPEPQPETKHKYKVGDKVRVRKDLTCDYYGPYDCFCTMSMAAMRGQVVTIFSLDKDKDLYTIEEGPGARDFHWSEEMFEGLVEAAPELHTDWSWEDLF